MHSNEFKFGMRIIGYSPTYCISVCKFRINNSNTGVKKCLYIIGCGIKFLEVCLCVNCAYDEMAEFPILIVIFLLLLKYLQIQNLLRV